MRILHTSDWHLGISHGSTSRAPDHDLFLAWLEAQLAEQAVDALIIAGDVFDTMQPSADAQRRYYALLGRIARTGVRQVVVVGGNHDSASRLDAPGQVLAALDVHVVGGIEATPDSWERGLVPLRRRGSDEVGAVVLAVPYVHEFRLGVRTTDADQRAVRAAFEERFGAVYRHLADVASARWPGVPLVSTGHLTLGASRREDYPQEIHQVGMIDGLPDTVIDPRIQYTALGHIHRSYPVGEARRAWYSGSPIALSLPETRSARCVLLVDLAADPAGQAHVEKLEVPAPRGLIELRDAPDALVAAIRSLRWTEPLPPLLFCRVVVDAFPGDLATRLHEALQTFPEGGRPALVELRQERAGTAEDRAATAVRPLGELDPREVFAALCRARGEKETSPLDAAFSRIASATDDDFEAMVADAARVA